MWWIYALLSAVFASLTAILAKKGVENIDSDLATAIRTVVVLFITWAFVIFKGNNVDIHSLSMRNWVFLLLSGLATGLSWLFYFRAIQLANISQVAPIDKLSLAFTIFLAVIFLGESLSLKTATGALLILAGSWLIVR
jgi:bacterial/archaeal transporter family protein